MIKNHVLESTIYIWSMKSQKNSMWQDPQLPKTLRKTENFSHFAVDVRCILPHTLQKYNFATFFTVIWGEIPEALMT